MIPAYFALSSPRASFSQCDVSSSSSAERSLKHQTRIINYRGQSDERSMREQALSFSIPVPEKLVSIERTGENGQITNNCENVCGYSKEIDSAQECGFRSGKTPKAINSKRKKCAVAKRFDYKVQ